MPTIGAALRILSWALLATITILSVIPAPVRPGTGAHNVEHIVIFLLTGFAFGRTYSTTGAVAIKLAIFAIAIETVQLSVPGRHARLIDLVLDLAGLCVGILLASIFDRKKRALLKHGRWRKRGGPPQSPDII